MKILTALVVVGFSLASAEEVPSPSSILTAVVKHILVDKSQESTRKFYGTENDHTVLLLDGTEKWPEGFAPKVEGFTFVLNPPKEERSDETRNRRLAIRLDRFESVFPPQPRSPLDILGRDSPIQVTVMNGGGIKNGGVIGGQWTWYSIIKIDGKWTVEFTGLLD